MTIDRISDRLQNRQTSSIAITNECLDNIAKQNPRLNLFITVTGEKARKAAAESDERIVSSKRWSKLDGVPLAVKDNFFIKGIRCTAGSKILSNFFPDYTAPSVESLESSGAVILGTTNMHEFASGVTTVNPHYGPARNPWDPERICGGSSGGSAAVVAAGLAFAALGTDTGGSVRIPASLCGVVGLKPTYGLVSTRGTIPLSYSLDHVGVLAQTCVDAAIVLDSIATYDPNDPCSVNPPREYNYFEETLESRNDRLRRTIGVPEEYFLDYVDDEVSAAFQIATKNLRSLGHEVSDIRIPNINRSEDIWAPIRFGEALAYHRSWLKERPSDYGEDVRAKLERGKNFSAVDYILAKKDAREYRAGMIKAMEGFDCFITPTTPFPAPKIGEANFSIGSQQLDVYSALVRQTLPLNVSGLPAVTIPMSFTKQRGLPLGLQIVGRPFDEATILGVGSKFESRKF
jgi:aspartyl-tRNA(Asn)/glutamyl-tRNA(Gln) amidotransferase subunit A